MKIDRVTTTTIKVSTDDVNPLHAPSTSRSFTVSLPEEPWSLHIRVADIDRLIDLLRAYKEEVSK